MQSTKLEQIQQLHLRLLLRVSHHNPVQLDLPHLQDHVQDHRVKKGHLHLLCRFPRRLEAIVIEEIVFHINILGLGPVGI